MATWYVDYANGSDSASGATGAPFKTPQRANTAASSGDTIKLRGQYYTPATLYKTTLNITKSGTTWEPDTGHAPAFDGNWDTSFQRADGQYNWPDGSCIPDIGTPGTASFKEFTATITITGDDVTFRGIRVQNSAGQGIVATAAHRVKITDCTIDHCFGAGMVIQGTGMNDLIDGAEVGRNTISRLSFKGRIWNFAALIGKPGTQGSMNVIYCTGAWIHHNLLCYGMGEGINAGRGGTGSIIEYNTVHTCNHLCLYINRTKNCVIRNNFLTHTYNPDFIEDKPEVKGGPVVKDQNVAAGIVLGDECGQKMPLTYYSEGQQVYNNIIVGMGAGIDIRNSYKVDARGNTDGYDTQLKNAWIAHNTIVGRGRSTRGIMVAQTLPEWGGGRTHVNSIIENNVVHMWYGEAGYELAVIKGAIPGVLFRNNAWYASAAALAVLPRAAVGAGDVTAAPELVNPDWPLADNYPNPNISNLNWYNYALRENSPLIGAASNRGRANGLTPPAMAYDYNGAARADEDAANGRYYDIGAVEYGSDEPADPTVTASFTASVTSGVAPLSVTFTSTSSGANGGAIDRLLWEFGDGRTADTAGPHTRTYSRPGTYPVRLTVLDTTQDPDIYSISAETVITVTETGPTGGAVDAVRVAMSTGAGNQTIAFNLGGAAPDLVLFFLSNATAAATTTDNALFAIGAASPGSQWSGAIYSRDAQGTTSTRRYFSDTAAVISIDHTGITGAAAVTQFAANSVTLAISDTFPAAYLLTAVAFADTAHLSKAGVIDLATAAATGLGFAPDFMLLASTFQTNLATLGNSAVLSLSAHGDYLATLGSADFAGAHLAHFSRHNRDTSDVATYLGTGGYDNLSSGAWGTVDRTASGFQLFKDAAVTANGRAGYAALALGKNQAVYYGASPDSTGTVNYTVNSSLGDTDGDGDMEEENIEPGLLLLFMTLYDPENVDGETDYDSWTLAVVDAGATYSLNYADQGAAATSNSWVRADNSLVIRDSGGTVKAAGTVSLTATGFSINWTTVNATVEYPFHAIAIRKPLNAAGPVAAFSGAPTEPTDGVVAFTDQSNPNGAAITWAWDFGDGRTATTQNPTHTYLEYGTYTVRLTVTNVNGSNTVTKANYIRFLDPAAEPWLVGPYEPMTVTNTTVSRLHGDDPSSPNYGRVEIGLDLDGLLIDASPADAAGAVAGKLRIVSDLTNNRLKVILPNGTVKYVNFA